MASSVTLQAIAKRLGLSSMTVSRALNNRPNVNEKTRERILKTATEMGYRPNHIAKSLVLKKTFTIGVVVPEITHSFFPEIIRGIEDVTYKNDYQLILTHSAEDGKREGRAIAALEAKRVDGILISVAENVTNYKVYQDLLKSGTSFVFYDRCVYGIGATCVSINDEISARNITQHLINHGYKKIAHLSGPPKISISKNRLQGFLKAMRAARLPVPGEWIVQAGLQENEGYKAMKKLLALPGEMRPRAVVAVNDPAAFGAMQAIYEAGLRIPEDVALVGFSDDIRAALMPSPLTTVRQPAYEVGKVAAEKLIATIEGKLKKPEEIRIDTELIIRQSCGCNLSKTGSAYK